MPIAEPSKALEGMKKAWGNCSPECAGEFEWISEYRRMLAEISGLGYSAKDVEIFSIALAEFQCEKKFSERAGLFLSALINNCEADEFAITTRHLTEHISILGFQNKKKIRVEGDIADNAGWQTESGTLIVNGNAAKNVGAFMSGGAIIVNGNAGGDIGNSMWGGNIIVAGDAGNRAGWNMWGGAISIEGDAGNALGAWMLKGSITVKGNAGDIVGMNMGSGRIFVGGNAGDGVGQDMTGGEIRLSGSFVLSDRIKGGIIFHNRDLVFCK